MREKPNPCPAIFTLSCSPKNWSDRIRHTDSNRDLRFRENNNADLGVNLNWETGRACGLLQMDRSSLISHTALPEMWHFPMVPVVREPASGMGQRDASLGESTVTEQSGGNRSRKKRQDSGPSSAAASEDESSKLFSNSSGGNDLADTEAKSLQVGKSRAEIGYWKAGVEACSTGKKQDKNLEPPKLDYIHVRARRGQATDSHSLAERARREKISERMKILQDLVPGCNKVIGKATVLDEIINYIQALQRQVELLSMKLEAVNSRINTVMAGFPPKDTYQSPSSLGFSSQATKEYEQEQGSTTDWLHMQIGGAFQRVT